MTGLLETAGIRQRDKAHAIATLLSMSHRPLTLLLRDAFGIRLALAPVRTGQRAVSEAEASYLAVPPGTPCKWRTSRLLAGGGALAAGAFLLWLPARLPAATLAALDAAAEPAGLILSRLPGGMHRERPEALARYVLDEITGEEAAVTSRAVLVAGGRAVGMAEENLMTAFVEGLG